MQNACQTSEHPIRPELERMIRAELQPDEKVVWLSGPNPGKMARKSLPVLIFGIPWTILSLVWMAVMFDLKMPTLSLGTIVGLLLGVPSLLLGLLVLSTPWRAARQATRTAYVITNARVLLVETLQRGRMPVCSILPHQLTDVYSIRFSDGSGNLYFNREDVDSCRSIDIGFECILDVQAVESLVLTLAKSASQPSDTTHDTSHPGPPPIQRSSPDDPRP